MRKKSDAIESSTFKRAFLIGKRRLWQSRGPSALGRLPEGVIKIRFLSGCQVQLISFKDYIILIPAEIPVASSRDAWKLMQSGNIRGIMEPLISANTTGGFIIPLL